MNQDAEGTASERAVEYRFGPFRVDLPALQVWRGDNPVGLTPKAFDTLLVLIRNRHRLVRKDELISAVWTNVAVSEDSLSQVVAVVRRALGDDPHQPEFIATVPRRGYRFIAPVTEITADQPASAAPEPPAPVVSAAEPPQEQPTEAEQPASRTWAWRREWVAIAAALVTIAAFTIGTNFGRPLAKAQSAELLRFNIEAPPGWRLLSGGALSPDSHQLAFVAQDAHSGATRLWVRNLQSGEVRAIDGTDGGTRPFWSPDARTIGFFAGGRLKRVGLSGGPVQTLASTSGLTVSGGSWSADDIILFSSFRSGVSAVPASGGEVTAVTQLDVSTRETAHRWPQFVSNGRDFLYSIYSEDPERTGTYIGRVGSSDKVRLVAEPGAVYSPAGYLLYVRDRVLMAQPVDLAARRVAGGPSMVAGEAFAPRPTSGAVISGSADLLTFGGRDPETRLGWFSRSGEPLGEIKSPPMLKNPSLSHDERLVVGSVGADVWVLDLERGTATRTVSGNTPLLSPDGTQIAFTSGRTHGVWDMYIHSIAGRREPQLFLSSAEDKLVNDWSRDGRYIIFSRTSEATKMDLWLAPTADGAAQAPLLATPFNEFQAQVSPDGRWMAYASDESGTWEVYVQSFPTGGGKRAISAGGGSEPQWRPDGRELFYLTPDGMLMAVDVQPSGAAFQASRPQALFRTSIPLSGEMNTRRNHLVPTRDGRRFLIDGASDVVPSITMLVNWTSTLKR